MAEPTIQDLFDLKGKVALLTGGSGYLGRSIASGLAEAGASVVVSSRDRKRADQCVSTLSCKADQRHFAVEIDHLDPSSIETGFDRAVSMAGEVNILVNNGQHTIGTDWTSVTASEFNEQLANATGYFVLARKMRDHAVARGDGASIVLLGSMYGIVGSYPDVYEGICAASPVAYHVLKGGVIQLTRHLAVYWAKDNVRVNCLSPGPFPSSEISAEMTKRLCERTPLRRVGSPWELKGAVVFLASAASSYMTGQNLVIDGGWSAW